MAASFLFVSTGAYAQSIFWSGSGTWDTSTPNWTNTSDAAVSWPGGTATATFRGTAGTVSLVTTPTINYGGLSFLVSGYQLTGGKLQRTTGTASLDAGSGITATINSTLGGGAYSKTGVGTIVFDGLNDFTGAMAVSGGKLVVTSATGLGTTAGSTTVSAGATLDLQNVAIGENIGLSSATLAASSGTSSTSGSVSLTGASNTIDVTGTQLSISNGLLNSGGGFSKTGGGTLLLTGSGTYAGATQISAGTVVAGHYLALGTSAGTTTVSYGATLGVQGGIGASPNLFAEPLSISGSGVSSVGAINNVAGVNTHTATIMLEADSYIGSTSGTLNLNGAVSTSNEAVGILTLTKVGSGTVVLGASNTSNRGHIVVDAGRLVSAHANALGNTNGTTTVNNGAGLGLRASIVANESLTLNGSGISNEGALYRDGTATVSFAGPISLGSNSTIGNGSTTNSLTLTNTSGGANALALGAHTLTVAGVGSTTIGSRISGTGAIGLIKADAGTLTLNSANNTYTGLTRVDAGTLTLGASYALPETGAVTIASGATLNIGATSQELSGNFTVNGTLQCSTNGTVTLTGGSHTISQISGPCTIEVGSGATLALAGGFNSTSVQVKMAGGALNLGTGPDITIGTLSQTANSTVNFAGSDAATLRVTTLIPDTFTMAVTNWTVGVDHFFATNVSGSPAPVRNTYDQPSLNRITMGSNPAASTYWLSSGEILGGGGTYWDGELTPNNGVLNGGSGTWNASNANWTDSGGSSNGSWIGTTNTATFGGQVSGMVTVEGTQNIGGLSFVRDGYQLGGTGSLTGTGVTLTASESVTAVVSTQLLGSTYSKMGLGTVVLSSTNNNYAGVTTVTEGTLALTTPQALGTSSAAANTVVSVNGTLDLRNALLVTEPITLQNGGTLATSTGSSSSSGAVTLTGATNTVRVAGTELSLTGALGSSGGFTKSGSGRLVLGGNNTFTGNLNVGVGTLVANSANALGGIGGYTDIDTDASLGLQTSITVAEPIRLKGDGVAGLGALYNVSGDNNFGGAITLYSNSTIGSSSGLLTLNNATTAMNLDTYSLTVTGAGNISISSGINGTGSLIKNGSGTLTLTSTKAYSGGTTVSAGTLVLGTGNQLPAAAAMTVGENGTLSISGNTQTFSNALTVNGLLTCGASGAIVLNGGTHVLHAIDVPSGNCSITLNLGATLTLAQSIDSTGVRVTLNNGTLKLAANKTYNIGTLTQTAASTIDFDSTGPVSLRTGTLTPGSNAMTVSNWTRGSDHFYATGISPTPSRNTTATSPLSSIALGSNAASFTYWANNDELLPEGGGPFWDGPDHSGNGSLNGGTGVWSTNGTNWTTSNGSSNGLWLGGANPAVFAGTAGTVTVQDPANITGLTFSVNNYVLEGPGALTGGGSPTVLSVGNNSATVNNPLAGGAFQKTGTGTLVLGGNNSYTGPISIGGGTLIAAHSNALGDPAAIMVVPSNISLGLRNGSAIPAKSLTISGTGYNSQGALFNDSGSNSYAGNITLNTASTISSASGLLTLKGDIAMVTHDFTLDGPGDILVEGRIGNSPPTVSRNNALIKSGSGTATLIGSSGPLAPIGVEGGRLIVAHGSALGGSSTGTAVYSTAVYSGAGLGLRGTITTTKPISLRSTGVGGEGGLFNVSGDNVHSGVVTVHSSSAIGGYGGSLDITGELKLSASVTFKGVADTAAKEITGTNINYGVTKEGSGTLRLYGANTYIGRTDITGGTVFLEHNAGLGATSAGTFMSSGRIALRGNGLNVAEPLYMAGGTTLSHPVLDNLGTVGGTNTYSGAIDIGGLGSTIQSTVGTLRVTGAMSTDATNRVLTFGGDSTVDARGTISGQGRVIKVGTGTTILSTNSKSYTGTTTINEGTLQWGTNGALSSSSVITVGENGRMDLQGYTQSTSGLTVDGKLVCSAGNTLSLSGTNTIAAIEGPCKIVLLANATLTLSKSVNNTGVVIELRSNAQLNLAGNTTHQLGTVQPTATSRGIDFGGAADASLTVGVLALGTGTYVLPASNWSLGADHFIATSITSNVSSVARDTPNIAPLTRIKLGDNAVNLTYWRSTTDELLVRGYTFWDGQDIAADGMVDGGDGSWGTSSNWTNEQGLENGGWLGAPSVATFQRVGGTVNVTANPTFGGLRFLADGYRLSGNPLTGAGIGLTSLHAETNVLVEINNVLQGSTTYQKTGAGTVWLSGASTYTGQTTVAEGTLRVTGSLASPVNVSAGATLSGSGTVAGVVGVSATAMLSPGTPLTGGLLTVGRLTLSGTAVFKLGKAGESFGASNRNDHVQVNGDLILATGATLQIRDMPDGDLLGGTYTLFRYTGVRSGTLAVPTGDDLPLGVSGMEVIYDDANKLVKLLVHGAPMVKVVKQATGGTGRFEYALTGLNAQRINLTTTTEHPLVESEFMQGTLNIAVTITEDLLPDNWPDTPLSASCSDLNGTRNGNGTATFGVLTGAVLSVQADKMRQGARIVCIFGNWLNALSGTVFNDGGAPSGGVNTGTPNDGLRNGAEAGISGVTVNLTNCSGTTLGQAVTDAGGAWTIGIPHGGSETNLCVMPVLPAGHQATGANAGGTVTPDGSSTPHGGINYTYSRAQNQMRFAKPVSGMVAMNFGVVPPSKLDASISKAGAAGGYVVHAHQFTAGTAGSVQISTGVGVTTPPNGGWREMVYLDPQCSGALPVNGTLLFPPPAPQNVVQGQPLCFVVQQFVAGNALPNSTRRMPVVAEITFTNASTLSLSYAVEDYTTLDASQVQIHKEVRTEGGSWSISNQAKPGDVVEYRITVINNGISSVNDVVINDATPAYTGYWGSRAVTLPPLVTGCAMTTPANATAADCTVEQTGGGESGLLRWVLQGALAPSARVELFYSVKLR